MFIRISIPTVRRCHLLVAIFPPWPIFPFSCAHRSHYRPVPIDRLSRRPLPWLVVILQFFIGKFLLHTSYSFSSYPSLSFRPLSPFTCPLSVASDSILAALESGCGENFAFTLQPGQQVSNLRSFLFPILRPFDLQVAGVAHACPVLLPATPKQILGPVPPSLVAWETLVLFLFFIFFPFIY